MRGGRASRIDQGPRCHFPARVLERPGFTMAACGCSNVCIEISDFYPVTSERITFWERHG